jgi:hypothetical protein
MTFDHLLSSGCMPYHLKYVKSQFLNRHGNGTGHGVDVFCPFPTQTHKVQISPNSSQLLTGMKSRAPNSYPTGFEYPHSVSPPYELQLSFSTFLLKKG